MLLDVYPPSAEWPHGFRLNVADGLMRLRYREGMASPKPLEPAAVYEVRVPLYPTSNLFAAGHRIQLLISSSSFPRFDVNPNTGEPSGGTRARKWRRTPCTTRRRTLEGDAAGGARLAPGAAGSDPAAVERPHAGLHGVADLRTPLAVRYDPLAATQPFPAADSSRYGSMALSKSVFESSERPMPESRP